MIGNSTFFPQHQPQEHHAVLRTRSLCEFVGLEAAQ
jgi:hypothetical protein